LMGVMGDSVECRFASRQGLADALFSGQPKARTAGGCVGVLRMDRELNR
jgi:hypothetical protein